ncbi:hypothetical protein I302_108549 [Kwoniella bestiolae CBS 10118]|uniref:BRCT domain-containing protein n=1 Tax=Kwoniella bestiolae CBS 10118 TaxID=1296100 RepID=A0A1B9FVF3_9TREE|nr:hypothetical protein I302_07078 [Kwoniella bestiolae CBS 10118]OCF22738.1 hypothetical protein I302_07078 [Kwoniella bestiolae CBS 10118]
MSTFAGQAFWVVRSNEDKKVKLEQIIRDHGRLIAPTLHLANRVIFLEPDQIIKNQIADTFKAFEEANQMNELSGNCVSLAERWITESIIQGRIIGVEKYLVKREELFNMAFWMGIQSNINNDSKVEVTAAPNRLEEKDEEDHITPGSLDKVVIDLTSDDKPTNDLTKTQEKAPLEEGEIGEQIVVNLGPRKYKASRSDLQVSKLIHHVYGGETITSSSTASDISSESSSSLTSLSDLNSEFGDGHDTYGSVKHHHSQVKKVKPPKSTKRYSDQKTVQPQDQEAFNALVKDLKY